MENIEPVIRKANLALIGVVTAAFVMAVFIGLPLWLHWAEVIFSFWGLR